MLCRVLPPTNAKIELREINPAVHEPSNLKRFPFYRARRPDDYVSLHRSYNMSGSVTRIESVYGSHLNLTIAAACDMFDCEWSDLYSISIDGRFPKSAIRLTEDVIAQINMRTWLQNQSIPNIFISKGEREAVYIEDEVDRILFRTACGVA